MATLKATGCRVGTQSITIFFSENVDSVTATTNGNYSIFAPDAGLVNAAFTGTATVQPDNRSVLLEWPTPTFAAGQWVMITVTNINSSVAGVNPIVSDQVSGRAPSESARITRDVEDAISYPILTEEVAYRPSPVGIPTSGAGGIAGPGSSNLGQVALQAVSDVLGWKANPADPKGFIGALTQSFTLADVEGHVEATWKPRSYAVQTDLGGGITGAQASLYMRAKDALDQSLTLLDGLYPLDPEADPEYVRALREMARSQMAEIIKELGVVGLPSILRINTYFGILLGQDPTNLTAGDVQLDPDRIEGTLGELRDTYGIYFQGNPFNNSVQDEQDITNFRVISDYMTSMLQSWIANREFFILKPRIPAFFGTQLVLISRQFNVIAETVNELRFALDSVFIGPNERQTLLLEFDDHSLPPMFLEDVLDQVDSFVAEEGPRLLRDGGKISVTNNILPVVDTLRRMIQGAHNPKDQKKRVPDGFRTARVRHALDDLQKQLTDLVDLTKQVEQQVPPPEGKPIINSVKVSQSGSFYLGNFTLEVDIFGDQFDSAATVQVFSTAAPDLQLTPPVFHNSQYLELVLALTSPTDLSTGNHDIVVTNPGGPSTRFENAFYWDAGSETVSTPPPSAAAVARRPIIARPAKGRTRRQTELTVGGQRVPSGPAPAASRSAASAMAPTSGTVPDPATATPSGATTTPVIDQQLTALQDKHDAIQQGVADLKAGHTTLSQKIDDAQKNVQDTLANHLAEAKSTHASFVEEVRGLLAKIPGLGESKKTKGGKDE